jgi:hypothetical protein
MTAGQRPAQSPPPHPELDTLADLDAGVLAGADAERIAAHVATCARCGQALAALGGVRAELRALPAPPIPAAVAARLDSTLAELSAAAPHDARTDRPAAAQAAPAPVADLAAARERRWRRLKGMTGAAAAVLALVVAGASITSLVRTAGGGSDSSAAGGGGGMEQHTASEREDSAAAPDAASAPTSLPPLPSFDRTTLRSALPSIEVSAALTRAAAAGKSSPAGAMADVGLRTACAETIPGNPGVLRAVSWIRYNGQPAYVFVFDDAGARVAYVVGDQCGRSPAVPATVLDTVR